MRFLVRHHIGKTCTLGDFRSMLEAIVKSLQKVFCELRRMGISCFHFSPLSLGKRVITKADEIHHQAFGGKGCYRVQVRRNARRRMQGDREPDLLDIGFRNAVAAQEVACGVCTVDLEAQAALCLS